MNYYDLDLIEKYFNSTCTSEEARQVMKWFETQEGQQYLKARMDNDAEYISRHLNGCEIQFKSKSLDSDKVLRSIKSKIRKKKVVTKHDKRISGVYLKIAASILVIVISYSFYLHNQSDSGVIGEELIFTEYSTSNDQHRIISLDDGTQIRLNENSRILVSDRNLAGDRRVQLDGEAFFDVVSKSNRQFIVEAKQSSIKVLGTSFNVKSRENEESVQVAVLEGSVSLGSIEESTHMPLILQEGEFGYIDFRNETVIVENFGVQNYVVWMKGRLNFSDQPLGQICIQLKRLYEIQCQFEYENLKSLRLTADFSPETIDKTLMIIALSLEINFNREDSSVRWLSESIR